MIFTSTVASPESVNAIRLVPDARPVDCTERLPIRRTAPVDGAEVTVNLRGPGSLPELKVMELRVRISTDCPVAESRMESFTLRGSEWPPSQAMVTGLFDWSVFTTTSQLFPAPGARRSCA